MTCSAVGSGGGIRLPGHARDGEVPHWDHPLAGAGGVEATISDLAAYAPACLPPRTPLGAAITAAQAPQIPPGNSGHQALRWQVREDGSHRAARPRSGPVLPRSCRRAPHHPVLAAPGRLHQPVHHPPPGIGSSQSVAVIDWPAAIAALGPSLPCSGGEQRVLKITASLADGIPVDLRDTITGLDDRNIPAPDHRDPPRIRQTVSDQQILMIFLVQRSRSNWAVRRRAQLHHRHYTTAPITGYRLG